MDGRVSYLSRYFGSLFKEYNRLRDVELEFEWRNICHQISTSKKKLGHVKNVIKDALGELKWVADELLKLEANMIIFLTKDDVEQCNEVFGPLKKNLWDFPSASMYQIRKVINVMEGVMDKLTLFINLPELAKLDYKYLMLKGNLSAVRNYIPIIEKFDSNVDDVNFNLFLAIDSFEQCLKLKGDNDLYEFNQL
mgnify:CR=1 FL=1